MEGGTRNRAIERWNLAGCLPYEEFENGKDIGLDHYEVRSFVGWFRHITLVLLVLAMLTVICTQERLASAASESKQTPPFPIALTVPEVRRLLGRLLFPLARSARAVLAWSWWRRCQQARASASHAKDIVDMILESAAFDGREPVLDVESFEKILPMFTFQLESGSQQEEPV